MPQGKVIAIRPIALADDSHSGDQALTEKASYHNRCDGEVQILDGEHKGEIAHFDQKGRCCGRKVGEEVELKIISTAHGKVVVELIGC